ncbi:MAG: metallophosphoesterase family protein, partial [Oscillospiraceae bacterium]|nr:metallophosphoesterase family protein [Oscillospiraceae bacterium]
TVGGKRIFITHGHQYRVKYEHDFRTLAYRAAALNADLVVFGHTHTPHTSYVGSMTIINPGSISYSHTYAVAEIDGNNLKTEIIKL